MTLAEKASQMISSQAPAIPRLGIQAYGWWNEALHGVSRLQLNPTGNATTLFNTTSYPISLALGASWDPSVMYREANAIGDEAREVVPNNTQDLDFYSPTINLARDPRWGRNDEAFSEDPLLTSAIASHSSTEWRARISTGTCCPRGADT
jgi:beta-glucosidase